MEKAVPMNSEDLLAAQRRLRGSLLDTRRAAMPGSNDLAAYLLLYLDDAEHCWRSALHWMRRTLDADRSDGGFAAPGAVYRPSGEAVRGDLPPPRHAEMAFDPDDAALHAVWRAPGAVVFEDIAGDRRFAAATRAQLLGMGMRAKLAIALRDGDAPMGLICCNWGAGRRSADADLSRQVGALSSEVLGPILAAAGRLREDSDAPAARLPDRDSLLAQLTAGELDVARLAVTGMSYKEIAARLNRSFSTVDHRLRAIREKSGARSTARMIAMLSELLAASEA